MTINAYEANLTRLAAQLQHEVACGDAAELHNAVLALIGIVQEQRWQIAELKATVAALQAR